MMNLKEKDLLRSDKKIIRFKFTKKDEFKYLSHLDIIRIISRASARAGLKLVYGKGFNPKPKMSFSNPTPLGVESLAEYCDMELAGEINAGEFINLINKALPEQLGVVEAKIIGENVPKLMSEISFVLYRFNLIFNPLLKTEKTKKNEKIEKTEKSKKTEKIEKTENKFALKAGKISQSAYAGSRLPPDAETIKQYFINEINKNPEIYNSIYSFSFCAEDNNFIILEVLGYAKNLKGKDNLIFKFNNFLNFLNDFIKKYEIKLESFYKVEMYLNLEDKLVTPLDVV